MSRSDTTLKRMCPSDGFKATFEMAVRSFAGRSRQSAELNPSIVDSFIGRHAAALDELADFIHGMALSDPLIWGLWLLASYTGGDTDRWGTTGQHQTMLLHQLGRGPNAPDPRSTVAELLAAGVQDFAESKAAENLRLEQLEADRTERTDQAKEIHRLERELTESKEREAALQGELTEAKDARQQMAELLESNVAAGTPVVESKKPSKLPRREKAGDHPGVYKRTKADGETVYEIGWMEDGKQRWKIVGPDLEEAIAARIQVTNPERAAA